LIGECGAPDTPASQPGFAGNIFHGAIRSAHHRARIRAARWLLHSAALDRALQPSIMPGNKKPGARPGFGLQR